MYARGKEKGVEEYKIQQENILNNNFVKSYEDTSKILKVLNDFKITVISARLKVENINNLKIALSIKQSEELNNKIEDIYNIIYDLEDSTNSDNYRIDFSIIKVNDNFSDKCVEGDGYIYKHRLFANEKRTRTKKS
jgi:hypothetical protein